MTLLFESLTRFGQHRELKSLMFVSSNDTLISFLSAQVESPNKKIGRNALISLFVQLFAFSDAGYPDFAKLGKCRPIFDTQTKLESLITHSLFYKVHQSCSNVLKIIFDYALEMIKSVNDSSSRDQQGGITTSEQNFEYALCALVNISLSLRWCMESNSDSNPYSLVNPCVYCQINTLTSVFFRELQPLQHALLRLQSRGRFGSRILHLISDWWNRLERHVCTDRCCTAAVDEVLKSVKKIVCILNLEDAASMDVSLEVRLSGIAPVSPFVGPLSPPQPNTPGKVFAHAQSSRGKGDDVLAAALHQTPSRKKKVSSPWSLTRMAPPQSENFKPTRTSTCYEQIPRLLKCVGRGVCELDLADDGSE